MKRSVFLAWLILCLILVLVGTTQALIDSSASQPGSSSQVYGASVLATATATQSQPLPTQATHEHRGDGSGHPTATPYPDDSPLDPLSDF